MIGKVTIILCLGGIFLASCHNTQDRPKAAKTVNLTNTTDKTVKNAITNNKGVTLTMLFNKPKGTATVTLNGETIEMKQDTVASGIKYSNAEYEFTEWHSDITLKKNRIIIFVHKP